METKVASIHFAPVQAIRQYRGQLYTMPAAKLNGDPNIITTRDLFQNDEGPLNGGTKRQKLQYLVKGEEIARCIVGEWTGSTVVGVGMSPVRHPGIWIVRDKLPVIETQQKIISGENVTHEEKMVIDAAGTQVFRPATDEEREAMWAEDLAHARMADRAYAEWCWNEGNRIWLAWQRGSKEPVPREMPPVYKLAAQHYGLDAEWLKEAASSNHIACPSCEKLISKTAMICQFCNEPPDLQRWAEWKARKDSALAAAVASVSGPQKAGKMPLPPPVQLSAQQPGA